jgi:protein ImuB
MQSPPLWLALHLPALPLEALHQGLPEGLQDLPQVPWAVTAQRRVVQPDAQAQHLGVRPGMTLAAARSLVPALGVLERDPRLEQALMQRLALALSRYTPGLVLQGSGQGLAMDVTASCRLFGGTRALIKDAQLTVKKIGLQHPLWATASTATAAGLLACVAPGMAWRRKPSAQTFEPPLGAQAPKQPSGAQALKQRLDALPLPPVLVAWQQAPALAALLQGVGCLTLGDVRALPRSGLMRRAGHGLIEHMDRAYGQASDLHPWWQPPLSMRTTLTLVHRIDQAPALVFAVQRLIEPLVGWLVQHGRAATRLQLSLQHETSLRRSPLADTVLSLSLGQPQQDAAELGLLLRERLSRLRLAAPVYGLTLTLQESLEHGGRTRAFWQQGPGSEAGPADARVRGLVDRLSARLGAAHVLRAHSREDHRPECAQRWGHPYLETNAQDPAPKPAHVTAPTAVRPTWLLAVPEPLQAQGEQLLRHGQPLVLLTPPERVEAGWFDERPVQRDYHQAVALQGPAAHQRLWIFRDRSSQDRSSQDRSSNAGQASATPRWYVHGLF